MNDHPFGGGCMMEATERTLLLLNEEKDRLASELAEAKQAADGWERETERIRVLASRSQYDAKREIERLQAQLAMLTPLAEAVGQHNPEELPPDVLVAYRFPESSWPYLERAER